MRRRTFLAAAVGGLASLLGGACARLGLRRPPMDPAARAALVAASRRLVPPSDSIDYIERSLREYFAPLREPIARGARVLDEISRRDWAVRFADLSAADQDRLLSYVQSGYADTSDFDGGRFVADLLTLTLEGFLGDPRHGGNAGEAGWAFIGYAPGGPRCHD